MSRRRPTYRKPHERPAAHKGLLLCLLLAGAVVLVPIGGGFMSVAKGKLRDAALASGLVDLNDCVVMPDETIACASGAAGTPVPVALHQMTVLRAQAAEDARRRAEAEASLRTLTAEVDRLNAEIAQNSLAADTDGTLPRVVTTVTRTGSTDTMTLPIQVMPNPAAETDATVYEPAGEE